MAKRKAAKKNGGGNGAGNEEWTAEENKVFDELGIGYGEVSLRRLIRGQRRINGKLYDSIDLIIAHLKQTTKQATPELKKAETLNDLVPSADPPRCESGPGSGSN
jgi:hypothetical protein